jgi:hypothetical protein
MIPDVIEMRGGKPRLHVAKVHGIALAGCEVVVVGFCFINWIAQCVCLRSAR